MDPAERLLVGVLGQALKDAHGKNPQQRAEARVWLQSDGPENICDLVGLSAQTLRQCEKFRMGEVGGDASTIHGK